MSKQTIEIEAPDGWELTGEYRRAMFHEHILHLCPLRASQVGQPMGSESEFLILRKIEPKRESRWMNIYSVDSMTGSVFSNRSDCDKYASHTRKAVVRIDYENGEPVSVALEQEESHG